MSSAILQIITMIAGFIIPRIMLLYYGSEINGLVSSITQVISYFSLVEAGLSSAAVYALYKPLASHDTTAISRIVVAAKQFYRKAGYIFLFLAAILAVFYPLYINSSSLRAIDIALLVIALCSKGVLDFFSLSKYRVLLTADQKIYVISIASMIYQILNTVLVIWLSYLGANIVVVKYLALTPLLLRSLILYLYCRRMYPYINFSEKPDNSALNKKWDALFLQILGVIHTGAPVVILTLVLKDLNAVSVYSVYNMVVVGLTGVLSIFTSGLSSSFGDVIARQETNTLRKAYREFEYAYYILITIEFSVAIVMIKPFVAIYTAGITDTDYLLPWLGIAVMANSLLYCLKTPQGMLVISAGLYKETRWQTSIQGAIMVLGGILLTIPFGIYGVVISALLSNLYRDIDLMFFIPKNVTGLPVYDTARRMLRVILCVLITVIPCHFIDISPSGYMEWAVYAVVVCIFAAFETFLINWILERDLFHSLIKLMRRLLNHEKRS